MKLHDTRLLALAALVAHIGFAVPVLPTAQAHGPIGGNRAQFMRAAAGGTITPAGAPRTSRAPSTEIDTSARTDKDLVESPVESTSSSLLSPTWGGRWPQGSTEFDALQIHREPTWPWITGNSVGDGLPSDEMDGDLPSVGWVDYGSSANNIGGSTTEDQSSMTYGNRDAVSDRPGSTNRGVRTSVKGTHGHYSSGYQDQGVVGGSSPPQSGYARRGSAGSSTGNAGRRQQSHSNQDYHANYYQ